VFFDPDVVEEGIASDRPTDHRSFPNGVVRLRLQPTDRPIIIPAEISSL
jgi:hypothetical protein